MADHSSPYLDLEGAVPDESGDRAWHFGQPLREQRTALESGAILDRSDRHIITVSGEPRLAWLHSLATQHVEKLPAHSGTELLVLTPKGRIEHHAGMYDDGSVSWLDVAASDAEAFLRFLTMMRFRTEVEIEDVTDRFALVVYTKGRPGLELDAPRVNPVPEAKFAARDLAAESTSLYHGAATENGWARRTDSTAEGTADVLVPRDALPTDQPVAGTWADDALRIAAGSPLFGSDTDGKTVPHEVHPWLARAVHLDKGCYRGQETVSKVHHLGQPPRRLVRLHLDGSEETPPTPGTPVVLGEKEVGAIGTAAQHADEGIIAFALLKRVAADEADAAYKVGDQNATGEEAR
ncbi:CAF17-like 4Fe-4S cluster assembly/insertion protein YgfZ [Salininema proteolyticum]|uniref:YgfZ/GcvT domain-containing protein n=1 Tax=Salininema proteolyticum TaxID=1607685 RepID=A0ABV8TT28_9ACTN